MVSESDKEGRKKNHIHRYVPFVCHWLGQGVKFLFVECVRSCLPIDSYAREFTFFFNNQLIDQNHVTTFDVLV